MRGQSTLHSFTVFCCCFFSERKFRNGRDGAVQQRVSELRWLLPPSWAQVSANRTRGEDSSSVFHSGVSSAVRELLVRSSPEWVCLRLAPPLWLRRSARWLVQRASAVCPTFYFEDVEAAVACVFSLCVLRGVRVLSVFTPWSACFQCVYSVACVFSVCVLRGVWNVIQPVSS